MPQHPLDGRGIEEVRRVLGGAREAPGDLLKTDREVELGGPGLHGLRRDAEPGPSARGGRGAFEGQEDLEEGLRDRSRSGASSSTSLSNGRSWWAGAQDGFAHPGEQRREGRIAREAGPQHQGVDEEADQPLGLGPGAAGDRRSDDAGRPGRCSGRAACRTPRAGS